jgi:uncharacterized membrane protein YesL
MSAFTVLVTTRIWQLAAINLMGLGLIVLGLGVFGIAPAMVACLWAVDRIEDHSAGSLVRGIWVQARQEALRSNLVAGPYLLATAGQIALAFGGGMLAPLWVAGAAISAAFAVAALVTLARMSGTASDARANAACAFQLAPYRLLVVTAALPAIALVVVWQPLVGLYFALSGWALFTNLLVLPGLASAIPNSAPNSTNTEALL